MDAHDLLTQLENAIDGMQVTLDLLTEETERDETELIHSNRGSS